VPRPPTFTPGEDSILRDTAGLPAEETNRLLEEAGFWRRPPAALKRRRHYLLSGSSRADDENELMRELRHRQGLTREQERLTEELATVHRSIEASTTRLRELFAQEVGSEEEEAQPSA
jgi:hypothetical protein